jgi:hypothetical protein
VLIPAVNELKVSTYRVLLGHEVDEVFAVKKKMETFTQLGIETKQNVVQID